MTDITLVHCRINYFYIDFFLDTPLYLTISKSLEKKRPLFKKYHRPQGLEKDEYTMYNVI